MESPSFLAQVQQKLEQQQPRPQQRSSSKRQPKAAPPPAPCSPGTLQQPQFELAAPLPAQVERQSSSSMPTGASAAPPISPLGDRPKALVPVASSVSEETILSQKSKSRVLMLDEATIAGYRQVLEAARYQEFYKAMQAARTI